MDLGADGNTSASVNAAAGTNIPTNNNDKETATMGTTPETVSAATTTTTTAPAAPAPTPVPAPVQAAGTVTNTTADQIRAAALAETSRIAAIRKLCSAQHAEIEAKAIGEGWDATRTELEVLRAQPAQGAHGLRRHRRARSPAWFWKQRACSRRHRQAGGAL